MLGGTSSAKKQLLHYVDGIWGIELGCIDFPPKGTC